MQRCCLITLLLLCSCLFSFSQKVNVDSVFQIIKKQPSTTKKVDDLINLYRTSVKQRQNNEAVIDEALLIAEDLFYINGIAKCYDRKGLTARYASDFSESIRLHKRALTYFQNTTDSLSKLKCLNNLGVSYRKIHQENEAFNYYFQALKLAEQINNRKSIAIANNGIGNIYVNAKEYDKAIEYLKKGFEEDVEYENDKHKEIGLSNIGEVFILKQSFDSAYYYVNEALDIAIKRKDDEGISIKKTLLGVLSEKEGNYTKAIAYHNEAIPVLRQYNSLAYLCRSLINKGACLVELKQYDKALENITNGLAIAKNINANEDVKSGYRTLVRYYAKKNDYRKALETQKKAAEFYDSIFNTESQESIESSQIAYESIEKDEQLKKLALAKERSDALADKRFNSLLYSLLFSAFIIFGLISFYFLNKRNVSLALDNKNKEIQNYLLQIKKLEQNAKVKDEANNFDEKFESYNLSKREQEVFSYISNGLTNAEIAEKLFLSKNTVKTHIKNIYAKLDVKTRIQALKKIND